MLLLAAIAAAFAAIAIPTIDRPIARWVFEHELGRGVWDQGISILEYAGGIEPWRWGGICVICAGVVVTLAVPRWRHHAHAWMLVALVHLIARNAVFWLKPATGRLRPTEWIARGGDTFFSGGIAFPSGHVALFASIALPVAIAWPRTRWAMAAVVAFVMAARVAVDAHFVSDVVAGLALCALVTWACAPVLRMSPPASRR